MRIYALQFLTLAGAQGVLGAVTSAAAAAAQPTSVPAGVPPGGTTAAGSASPPATNSATPPASIPTPPATSVAVPPGVSSPLANNAVIPSPPHSSPANSAAAPSAPSPPAASNPAAPPASNATPPETSAAATSVPKSRAPTSCPPTSTCPSTAISFTPSPVPSSQLRLPFGHDGRKNGNARFVNNGDKPLYVRSVGSWPLGGYRNKCMGFGTPEENVVHTILPGEAYSEPYRASAECLYDACTGPAYCEQEDKLAGQGIAIKIALTPDPADNAIVQFEYALYRNPFLDPPRTYRELNYDISLLDCGAPANATRVSDFEATQAMHDEKVAACPGYDGGLALVFGNDTRGANCPPIYCDAKRKCFMIYTWDRTRPQESSFKCEREYVGDMTLELNLGRSPEKHSSIKASFDAWAATATHEVLDIQLGKGAASVADAPFTAAAVGQTLRSKLQSGPATLSTRASRAVSTSAKTQSVAAAVSTSAV